MVIIPAAVSSIGARIAASEVCSSQNGAYTEEQKEQILAAYNERSSMRGIQRTFGVSRNTLSSWLKKRHSDPGTP
jgi:transposase-like protein